MIVDEDQHTPSLMTAVANRLVALHKQQFGRGPTSARANFAGADTLVCVLDGALLPAEHQMVAMGAAHRVGENRLFMQSATREQFVVAIEEIVHRQVRSFGSATDAERDTVMEVFVFESEDHAGGPDGPPV